MFLPLLIGLIFFGQAQCLQPYPNSMARQLRKYGVPLKIMYPEVWYDQINENNIDHDPTEAAVWLDNFNDELEFYNQKEAYLNWKFSTNITDKNSKAVADFAPIKSKWMKQKKLEAAMFSSSGLDRNKKRMLFLINNVSFSFVDANLSRQNAELVNKMSKIYSTTEIKMTNGKLVSGEPDLADLMRSSRNYTELLFAWKAWRDAVGPPIKPIYTQMIHIQNKGAKQQGYKDMGEVWRQQYEVPDIESEANEIWEKLKPFYMQFHAYIRRKLANFYGEDKVDVTGPIPAHLLGNMWAQEWESIIDIVQPYDEKIIDVTAALKSKGYTVEKLFRTAEDFYTSIGLYPMTNKFWKLSMLTEPDDGRKVDCHASAHDFSSENDFRIKMCSDVNSDNFRTVHHEMGHIEYFMAYSQQPEIFKTGANPGFHEAIGDSVTYSVMTPEHLYRIGLINSHNRSHKADINFLMHQALGNFPLLPWTLLLDFWRYDVYRGKINEHNYNVEWWKYRLQYQGIQPPENREENYFDPGAKFHVAYNVPYIRYFFARVLQLQFHSTMCDLKSPQIPLHHCDIYGSKTAGNVFKKMMKLGGSRPWWDALQVMTGSSKLDASPILEYYRPLHEWLKIENEKNGEVIGW